MYALFLFCFVIYQSLKVFLILNILYTYIKYIGMDMVGFYGMSTGEGDLMPNQLIYT